MKKIILIVIAIIALTILFMGISGQAQTSTHEWTMAPTGNSCNPACNDDHSEGDPAGTSSCGEMTWSCLNGTWGEVDGNGNKCTGDPKVCNDDHSEGDITCINDEEHEYTCNTNVWETEPTGNSCITPNSCPLFPVNVSSATFNIFDKEGNFVLTDPNITDNESANDVFNTYFRSGLESEIDVYNINNGSEADISLSDIGGQPVIESTTTPGYDFPIQAQVDNSCNVSLCSLNSNDSMYSNNPACVLNKTGEGITSNGCYDPQGAAVVSLLTSPNFMSPGEYCAISWCSKGIDIQSCVLTVDGEEVGSGISGTTNALMSEKTQQVKVLCVDDNGAEVSQKIGECRISPDWNDF